MGKIWEKSFAIWIALRPKRVLTCKCRNEHDACPKAHPTRNHDGGVVIRKKLADHVPSMSLDDQMAKAAIDLYRQGSLVDERSAQYIFDKFAEYSRADAEIEIISKGNFEFDLHDLSGQRLDLELREHLNHFTIGRFVELVLENSVKAKQSAAAIKRHQEHYQFKADVFDWLRSNMQNYKSMDATAEAIAGKIVPVTFRTARKWVKEYKDMQSAGRL